MTLNAYWDIQDLLFSRFRYIFTHFRSICCWKNRQYCHSYTFLDLRGKVEMALCETRPKWYFKGDFWEKEAKMEKDSRKTWARPLNEQALSHINRVWDAGLQLIPDTFMSEKSIHFSKLAKNCVIRIQT